MDATRIRKPANRSRTFRLAESRPIVIKIDLLHQGRREEARKVLAQGIKVTRRQGKQHALSNLQAALEAMQMET